ncbi:hypothetical protein [Polaribacter dokdonensis]|uniref:Membrane protein n=1 Tax=Polaribacter dokdonensis DSW-5 TaxID=1300348 RepID=A0A0M9CHV6_9FLAO|nr:hypothetical protein [Polaribacter dokdonensis]KOY52766.1 Membrane protein [Polaribacter dokdonensis DSW-5]SEE51964.1 hypothetical protein SAMN05444353_2101 [Polaribacter dokdonensis DSW-5]
MDVLDNYKKAWENQPEESNKLSSVEIYKMAHSRSSSIVKWIFIIGILEFIFWTAINLTIPDSFYKVYEDLELMGFLNFFMVLHYVIIAIFLFLFYKNFRRVSLVDNTKNLINRILKIRKTVKYYVFYNLATVFLGSIILNIVMFSDNNKLMKVMNPDNLALDMQQVITITVISQIIALVIILVLLWLFYKLVYGILLRKLNKNYKELVKLTDN